MKKFLIIAVAALTFGFSAANACCGSSCGSKGKDKGSESAGAKS